MLLVDAANVVGSRPKGWWKDRPGAARKLVAAIRVAAAAGRLPVPVLVVLEGSARQGVGEGCGGAISGGGADGEVRIVHAPASGDDTLVALAAAAPSASSAVTADRVLRGRLEPLGTEVVGPSWLYRLIDPA